MAKQKHHVFSARTTEEGLRLLNDLRRERGVGWDELVLDAVCAHYGLDRGVMAPPKAERLAKPAKEPKARKPRAKGETKAEESVGAVKGKAGTSEVAPRAGLEPTT